MEVKELRVCYSSFQACSAGSKEQEATNMLEKVVRNNRLDTEAEVVEATINCLQSVSLTTLPSLLMCGILGSIY